MIGRLPNKKVQRLRRSIRERDGDHCWYCGDTMVFDIETGCRNVKMATLEHKVDLALGGTNELDNLVLSHGQCNWNIQGISLHEKLERRVKRHFVTAVRRRAKSLKGVVNPWLEENIAVLQGLGYAVQTARKNKKFIMEATGPLTARIRLCVRDGVYEARFFRGEEIIHELLSQPETAFSLDRWLNILREYA